MLIKISNNTSSIYLYLVLCRLSAGVGFSLRIVRIRRKVHKRRDGGSTIFIGRLYGRQKVIYRVQGISIPHCTGVRRLKRRRTTQVLQCRIFTSTTKRSEGIQVTLTRRVRSGTRAVLFRLVQKDKLSKLYKVHPRQAKAGKRVCVHPFLRYDERRVRRFLRRQKRKCYASDAGTGRSCDEGQVQGEILPRLVGVGPRTMRRVRATVRRLRRMESCLRRRAISLRGGFVSKREGGIGLSASKLTRLSRTIQVQLVHGTI